MISNRLIKSRLCHKPDSPAAPNLHLSTGEGLIPRRVSGISLTCCRLLPRHFRVTSVIFPPRQSHPRHNMTAAGNIGVIASVFDYRTADFPFKAGNINNLSIKIYSFGSSNFYFLLDFPGQQHVGRRFSPGRSTASGRKAITQFSHQRPPRLALPRAPVSIPYKRALQIAAATVLPPLRP